MSKDTSELRIGDKIIVLDGVNPLRFKYVDDPMMNLYQFDEDGNILLVAPPLKEERTDV